MKRSRTGAAELLPGARSGRGPGVSSAPPAQDEPRPAPAPPRPLSAEGNGGHAETPAAPPGTQKAEVFFHPNSKSSSPRIHLLSQIWDQMSAPSDNGAFSLVLTLSKVSLPIETLSLQQTFPPRTQVQTFPSSPRVQNPSLCLFISAESREVQFAFFLKQR